MNSLERTGTFWLIPNNDYPQDRLSFVNVLKNIGMKGQLHVWIYATLSKQDSAYNYSSTEQKKTWDIVDHRSVMTRKLKN